MHIFTLIFFFQTIHLSASVGSTVKQQLPLKNAGNIGVNLKLKVGWLFRLEIMFCAVNIFGKKQTRVKLWDPHLIVA